MVFGYGYTVTARLGLFRQFIHLKYTVNDSGDCIYNAMANLYFHNHKIGCSYSVVLLFFILHFISSLKNHTKGMSVPKH